MVADITHKDKEKNNFSESERCSMLQPKINNEAVENRATAPLRRK